MVDSWSLPMVHGEAAYHLPPEPSPSSRSVLMALTCANVLPWASGSEVSLGDLGVGGQLARSIVSTLEKVVLTFGLGVAG